MNGLSSQEGFPQKGWRFLSTNDRGRMDGLCYKCQKTSIRYEYYLVHELWEGEICVGSECATKLSEEYVILDKRQKWKTLQHNWKMYEDFWICKTRIQKGFKFSIVIYYDKMVWKIQCQQLQPITRDLEGFDESFLLLEEAKNYALELISKIIFPDN